MIMNNHRELQSSSLDKNPSLKREDALSSRPGEGAEVNFTDFPRPSGACVCA